MIEENETNVKLYELLIKTSQTYESRNQSLLYGILIVLGVVIAFFVTSYEKIIALINANFYLFIMIMILLLSVLIGSFIYVVNLMNEYHSHKIQLMMSSTILSEKNNFFPKDMDPFGFKPIWKLQNKKFISGMILCFILALIIGILIGYLLK